METGQTVPVTVNTRCIHYKENMLLNSLVLSIVLLCLLFVVVCAVKSLLKTLPEIDM
jgi:hypothetical protein